MRLGLQGYLGYKKPELKKPYRILPPRFLNLRKRGPTDVGAQGFRDTPVGARAQMTSVATPTGTPGGLS